MMPVCQRGLFSSFLSYLHIHLLFSCFILLGCCSVQIRRMCSRSKFIVRTLHRVKIASILSIETIPKPGDCRWLTCEEVIELSRGLGLGIEKDDIESVEGDTS